MRVEGGGGCQGFHVSDVTADMFAEGKSRVYMVEGIYEGTALGREKLIHGESGFQVVMVEQLNIVCAGS